MGPRIRPRGTSDMISTDKSKHVNFDLGERVDPTLTPPQQVGKRLFMETRFAQYFAANYIGNVNRPLAKGDPVVENVTLRGGRTRNGPFAGRSISCRQCHLVGELFGSNGGGTRTYADFAQRSALPDRGDGQRFTPRNSISMVDSFIKRDGEVLLHVDGEFASTDALVKSTLTGRNMGWLPDETEKAIAHIAKVIREDDGKGRLGALFASSYAEMFRGDAKVPAIYRIDKKDAVNVASANDREIFNAVSHFITEYLESLEFARDQNGQHNGSPYDLFLAKNNLPRGPANGEGDAEYAARLTQLVEDLRDPKWVVPTDGFFRFHNQFYQFGPLELEGLKIFLRKQRTETASAAKPASHFVWVLLASAQIAGLVLLVASGNLRRRRVMIAIIGASVLAVVAIGYTKGRNVSAQSGKPGSAKASEANLKLTGAGNCVSCHTPPNFTDFKFHNTGASQEEYDSIHGQGQFQKLNIPSLDERSKRPLEYLPETPQHPKASNVFRMAASADDPKRTDLGMWNIVANPDYPDVQDAMTKLLCPEGGCEQSDLVEKSVARFRTPSIRDLGHSDPYLHTGRKATTTDVIRFYVQMSALARAGQLRNGAPELKNITLDDKDVEALAAFLKTLNEDYE